MSKLRTAVAFLGLSTLLGLWACSSAMAVSPGGKTDAPALRSIAFEHYLSGDSDAALDYYQKAIDTASKEYGPESSYIAQLYYEMGTLALDSKKFTHAESYLREAVRHNPNSVMARVKYAECLQVKGKGDDALVQIRAALAKHSNSPEAREALVSWLQANKRTASAIHESYNLSVAARGNAVPPPTTTVLATAADNKALVASAAIPAPVVIPKNSPLKSFAWMDNRKKEEEAKKAEAEKKAAEEQKKKLEEEKKAADDKARAEQKKLEKKSKQDRAAKDSKSKKDKSKKGAKSKQAPVEMVAQEQTPALRTTAKAIKPKKGDSESGDSAPVSMAPVVPKPILVGNQGKPRPGMVPPPPPTIPSFGFPGMGYQPPPPSVYSKPPKPTVAKKPKAPAPVAKEAATESPKAASSGGGNEEDPDFLLIWAGSNAKKKGK